MIRIGKSYIRRESGQSRLCADVTVYPLDGTGGLREENKRTLWFSLDSRQEDSLCVGRADAFVLVMLVSALRYGHDIVCEDPMSERLHYQLCDCLIPALTSAAGTVYHAVDIRAPLTNEAYPNQNAAGTGFSGGTDCLYTVMTHGKDCEYPLTHIAVFNAVAFQQYGTAYRQSYEESCDAAARFAKEQGLETVFLDTNFYEVLKENYIDAFCTFRIAACALALQGLFSTYFISSGNHALSEFSLNAQDCSFYDPLTVHCVQTESLACYLPGVEVKKWQKIEALSDWPPSYSWLHSCFSRHAAGRRNCGVCKKCKATQTMLYALGKLDRYGAVFDVEDYKKKLPQYLAYVMANQDSSNVRQAMQLLRDRNVPIPPQAYALEKQIRHAVGAMKRAQQAKEAPHE